VIEVLGEVASTLGALLSLVSSVPAIPLHQDPDGRAAQLVLGGASALVLFLWWVVACDLVKPPSTCPAPAPVGAAAPRSRACAPPQRRDHPEGGTRRPRTRHGGPGHHGDSHNRERIQGETSAGS
jgi:hypothetical protein